MNVTLIKMNKTEALKKVAAYKKQLQIRHDDEYRAALEGFTALAEGTPVVNIVNAINEGGLHENGLPKIAIARADRKQVECNRGYDKFVFDTLQRSSWGYSGSLLFNIPHSIDKRLTKRGYALVPMVPADVRPKGNLRNYFILWEVEHWSDKPHIAKPDIDPFLLKHIYGDMYAVVAQWDLTELERLVMTGRREG